MQLGSLAELIAAVASMGALVAAVFAARAAVRTVRQQRRELDVLEEERRERRAAEERAASSKVAVWARTDRGEKAVLRYINASELPIYALTIRVVIPGRTLDIFYTVVGPSPESRTMQRGSADLQDAVFRSCGEVDWMWLLRSENIAVSTTFRDLGNVWWHRALSGILTKHETAEKATEAALRDVEAWLAGHEAEV